MERINLSLCLNLKTVSKLNHLAHFYLSGDNEDIIIGNFIADFITNKEVHDYTEGIKKGIMLHRDIDAFTDSHETVKKSTKRLHPFHHKYSPVIVDVYYDFLLAKNWAHFSQGTYMEGLSVREFTTKMYTLLKVRQADLPLKLNQRLDRMIADDWLMTYTTYQGLNKAFKRIEMYAAFPGNFGNAAHHLELFVEDFNSEFLEFFPDLVAFVNTQIESS